jgi:vacuolar-type H+-ATPase subunit I/STV1
MKKQRLKAVALTTVLSASALIGSAALADQTLDDILQVSQAKTTLARDSQKRIDRLAQETEDLLAQFKQVNKQIEDMRVYNSQLEKQIAAQLAVIKDLDESIENVTVIERRIQPLVMRMLDSLEQFVEMDKPFKMDERLARIEMLRNNQDRADISVAEKFRQVLEAYKIESDYGRFIEAYRDTLVVGGQEREVNILRIGRVSLMYQTTDTESSGAWDPTQDGWVELDDSYRSTILKGLRIARNEASKDIMFVPVQAPEAAQ